MADATPLRADASDAEPEEEEELSESDGVLALDSSPLKSGAGRDRKRSSSTVRDTHVLSNSQMRCTAYA